jgi:hypothetical protein
MELTLPVAGTLTMYIGFSSSLFSSLLFSEITFQINFLLPSSYLRLYFRVHENEDKS